MGEAVMISHFALRLPVASGGTQEVVDLTVANVVREQILPLLSRCERHRIYGMDCTVDSFGGEGRLLVPFIRQSGGHALYLDGPYEQLAHLINFWSHRYYISGGNRGTFVFECECWRELVGNLIVSSLEVTEFVNCWTPLGKTATSFVRSWFKSGKSKDNILICLPYGLRLDFIFIFGRKELLIGILGVEASKTLSFGG